MGKVIEFRRVRKQAAKPPESPAEMSAEASRALDALAASYGGLPPGDQTNPPPVDLLSLMYGGQLKPFLEGR